VRKHKQGLQLPEMVMHGDTHGNNKKDENQEKEEIAKMLNDAV
jgi:hypothetical protein